LGHGIGVAKGFLVKYRNLLALGVAALLAELAYAILNLSALPVYCKYVLHSEQVFGVMLSVFLLTEAASRPLFGALGDRVGRKPLVVVGPAITAVTAYLTIKVSGHYTIAILIVLRAIDGLGSGALWPSVFAYVGDTVEENNRATAMSIFNVTYMAGLALGFLLGGAANKYYQSYNASFYLVSIMLALTVLVALIALPKRLEHTCRLVSIHGEPLENPTLEEPTPFKLSTLLRSFRDVPELIVLACVTFLGMGVLMGIIKLYALDHLGMDELQFGMLVAPIAAFMGIFAVPLGRVGDKYGKCRAVCWGLLSAAIAMWILALFRSIVLAAVAGIMIGLAFTVAFPAWMALAASATGDNRRGEVIGAVGLAQGLAAIVGASVGTVVYGSDLLSFPRLGVVNYNVPFWFSAILLSVSAVMAFTWMANKYCYLDPSGAIGKGLQRGVVAASVVGLAVLVVWIGWRYARPVAPDRVAWQWIQQLVRGRPDKALKFTVSYGHGWDAKRVSREASKRFHYWRKKRQARYTVFFAKDVTDRCATVPIKFEFETGKSVYEYVFLCKVDSGEWKVCGLTDGD
jgi:DHA1 family multidrug resistance protein-like MFS transporter